jgi:hypothetical protein
MRYPKIELNGAVVAVTGAVPAALARPPPISLLPVGRRCVPAISTGPLTGST